MCGSNWLVPFFECTSRWRMADFFIADYFGSRGGIVIQL